MEKGEARVYLVIRKDLKMRRGKEIAQACHAVIGLGCADTAMITVQVEGEQSLIDIKGQADAALIPAYVVRDLGRTEVDPGTATCLAVGPVARLTLPALATAQLY